MFRTSVFQNLLFRGEAGGKHTRTGSLVSTKKQTTYVPLQTIEHAWAGMSGMLRFGGARGAFYVPRR